MIDLVRLKRLLLKMIDIYSPSGKEEALLHYLKGFLKRSGFPVQIQPVDDHRYNIILAPADREIRLALVGHLDTVTAYDLEDYGGEEKGDEILGLGAADMKGGCAAMIEAFLSFAAGPESLPPAALCLVVGEEETGDGAARLMKEYRFPWALIGEPTGLVPCFESFGYIESRISAHGRRCHASLAGRRENAVEALLGRLIDVTRFFEHTHPDLIYNIRDLHTPSAGFAVPEYSEAWIDIHLPPAAVIGDIITEVEEIVTFRRKADKGIEICFSTEIIDAGYLLPEKGPVADSLRAACAGQNIPWRTGSFRSHSDANQMFAAGVRPVLFGPGHLEKAHIRDESVSFRQVATAAAVYRDFMNRFFRGADGVQ
jgi:acetylornithine deacetylase